VPMILVRVTYECHRRLHEQPTDAHIDGPCPAVPPSGAPSRPESTGLSDLAVSPFGMPTSLLFGEVRVAWLGRTSTYERQDPRQSLIRLWGAKSRLRGLTCG
jgi:hypothetical protein